MRQIWRYIRQCKSFPCKKIEIKRIANFATVLFLNLNIFWTFKAKSWLHSILPMSTVRHRRSYIPPHFSTPNHDMCRDTIGSSMIKILYHVNCDGLLVKNRHLYNQRPTWWHLHFQHNTVGSNQPYMQCFFLTKGPTFHVTANFYIIGFLTGWSYFSMSFDGLAAKVDCDWMSFGMWQVQRNPAYMETNLLLEPSFNHPSKNIDRN